MSQRDIARFRRNLRGEVDSAALYRALSTAEPSPELSDVYARLAAVEDRHADVWREQLAAAGNAAGDVKPGIRARTLVWLARRFGADAVLPIVLAGEQADSALYDDQPEARRVGMPADERSHGRVFRAIAATSRQGLSGATVARLEGRHRAAGGNALRAAVLGVNDGLVSNLSLIMGVAGASLDQRTVLLTGFAGLLAGAISMALGEWLSVQSARELYARQVSIEREELESAPAEELEELTLIYQAKGIPADRAHELAQTLIANPDTALDTLVREELGIDPEGLGGSAWAAAGTSFALFAAGALIPLLPYLFVGALAAAIWSGLLAAVGLFSSGVLGSLLTGQPVLRTGGRQVVFGLAAAAITFGLGRLVGARLGV